MLTRKFLYSANKFLLLVEFSDAAAVGKLYLPVFNATNGWNAASLMCQQISSRLHLVTLQKETEYNAVRQYMQTLSDRSKCLFPLLLLIFFCYFACEMFPLYIVRAGSQLLRDSFLDY